MPHSDNPELSILVPCFNEAESLPAFYASLEAILAKMDCRDYEIIFCDDGSSDDTASLIHEWHKENPRIKLISFSRNFGKEYALSALIAAARGKAILSLDADGQHPVDYIPTFIDAWKQGAQVVVGLHEKYHREGIIKSAGSKIFYKLFNSSAGQYMEPNASDFRLITREVQKAFLQLTETDRITRGLIDWLGFKRTYIHYETKQRLAGHATYNRSKLLRLATDSIVSMSPRPLYMFGFLGVFITFIFGVLGFVVLIEQLILEDPLNWNFTGTAMLGVLILFLVGILLMSQGLLSLYVSSIQNQSKNRPLYIIDYENSLGIPKTHE